MPRKDDYNPTDVPGMRPERDEIASRQPRSAGRRNADRIAADLREGPDVQKTGNTSTGKSGGAMLFLLFICVIALAAAAGYFFMENQKLLVQLNNNDQRISDLESRLSNTGDEIEQSSVAMQVKIKEMDAEIRKLWDNVWKKTKTDLASQGSRITKLEKGNASSTSRLAKLEASSKTLSAELGQSKRLATDVSQLKGQGIAMQASVDTALEKAESASASIPELNKRVADTEEWIGSMNAHRRQVIRDIDSLKRAISPASPGQ